MGTPLYPGKEEADLSSYSKCVCVFLTIAYLHSEYKTLSEIKSPVGDDYFFLFSTRETPEISFKFLLSRKPGDS